jgi:hypothetical protein
VKTSALRRKTKPGMAIGSLTGWYMCRRRIVRLPAHEPRLKRITVALNGGAGVYEEPAKGRSGRSAQAAPVRANISTNENVVGDKLTSLAWSELASVQSFALC